MVECGAEWAGGGAEWDGGGSVRDGGGTEKYGMGRSPQGCDEAEVELNLKGLSVEVSTPVVWARHCGCQLSVT